MKTKLVLWLIALLVLCSSAAWAQNTPPVASLTIHPNPTAPGQDVLLDGSGSYDPDPLDLIVSYEWDLEFDGDFGSDLLGQSVTHAYPTFGDRTVVLRVTDSLGASAMAADTIHIHEEAPCDQDGDSYVSDACGGDDCDDSDPAIHPGVIEESYGDPLCSDGADNDCDGLVDIEDSGCVEAVGKPNVIIFIADDQGYQDLGCYGSPLIETPVLDRMAEEGVRFTDFYAGGSRCTPSRAALMTGCYPNRVGFGDWVLLAEDFRGLHPDEITIAELLKTKGYATAMIGKWHLGHGLELFPTRQGFDRYLGIPYSNDIEPVPLYRNEEIIETLGTGEEQEKLTKMYTDEGIQFIHDNQDKPFFLCIALSMPHVPLHASDDFKGVSARGLYGDVIEEIDFHVGRVLDTLESLDLDRKTLVIYTSDNGPWLWWGDLAGSPEPFQGGKETNWEGGFRVPCVMRWPGSIPAGQVVREMTVLMDLYPTLAALAGAELPSGQVSGVDIIIDGRDIWPLMSGEPGATSPHEAFYYDLGAVRSGRWKLRDGMLFDLENDPHEDDDVSSQHPDKLSLLQQMLHNFSEEVLAESRPIGSALPPSEWETLSITEAESCPRSVALNIVLFLVLPLGTVILWRIRSGERAPWN